MGVFTHTFLREILVQGVTARKKVAASAGRLAIATITRSIRPFPSVGTTDLGSLYGHSKARRKAGNRDANIAGIVALADETNRQARRTVNSQFLSLSGPVHAT